MIDLRQPSLQALEVQLALPLRIQLPPQLLNARIAFVLRLVQLALELGLDVGDQLRDLHGGQSWHAGARERELQAAEEEEQGPSRCGHPTGLAFLSCDASS